MRKIDRWMAVLYAVLVVVVSSWPGMHLPNVGIGDLDKVFHFAQYAVFGLLVARGWAGAPGLHSTPKNWALVAILVVFAALDEYHQGWIPGRDPDWYDWLADSLGIASGFGTGLYFLCRRAKPT